MALPHQFVAIAAADCGMVSRQPPTMPLDFYSAKNGTGTKNACCSKMLAGPKNDVYCVKNKMNTYTSTTGIAATRASHRNTNDLGCSRCSARPTAQPVSNRAG